MSENTKDSKEDIDAVQHVQSAGPNGNEITVETVLNPEQRAIAERALVRKLDMRLLPAIVLIYIMNYIGMFILFMIQFLTVFI